MRHTYLHLFSVLLIWQSQVNAACPPVRKYVYALPSTINLTCAGDTIFNVNVPDTGRAVAQFTGVFKSQSTNIQSWVSYVQLGGTTGFAPQIGENICPQETRAKANIGYGVLSGGAQTVRVWAGDIYACPTSYGTSSVSVRPGSKLEVWVEDPVCSQQQIKVNNFFTGTESKVWTTSMSHMQTLPGLTKPAPATGNVTVLSTLEVSSTSSPPNPNSACGMQNAPMLAQTLIPGYGYLTTIIEQMPASSGMGHLVMNTRTQTPLSALPSSIAASLYVGTNTAASTFFTGRYQGYSIGTSVLAAVVDTGPTPSPKPLTCQRTSQGLQCQLTSGASYLFPVLSDANGWNYPQHANTIELGDIDGDGDLDVCARAASGYMCWKWNGSAFADWVQGPELSNGAGWYLPEYYATIHLGDINGDGKADVCARAAVGILCWPSIGSAFGSAISGPPLSDAYGWNLPMYYSTIRYIDHNGDGKADVCARWSSGQSGCWLSNGSGFPTFAGQY